MRARRHRPAGVWPLEVWDVLVGTCALYRCPDSQQPQAIAEVVRQLRVGSAQRAHTGASLPRLAIDRVALAGGGALVPVQRALAALGIDATVEHDAAWIAEPGGRALLTSLCQADAGAVVDVGQTSIKYCAGQVRARLPRSLTEVPLELHAREPALQPLFRAQTVSYLASVFAGRARPDGVVLAMPCEISDALVVAGCSYPWSAGDATLIEDVRHEAGLSEVPMLVLNDAELAAVSVGLTRPREQATLVLTVGLGLGAAYLPSDRLNRV